MEVDGLVKDGQTIADLAAVFDQRDTSVFVSDDEVDVAVPGPVVGGRGDHLHVHDERIAIGSVEAASDAVSGCRAGADVFKIGEAVHELAAEQIEIAVAVEVGEVR